MKKLISILLILTSLLLVAGCKEQVKEQPTIRFAAAASLEKMFEQKLLPMYKQQHPQAKLVGTYAGSGKLQIQIEQGMQADVFISASTKQAEALQAKGLVHTSRPLLKNELVLIVPAKGNSTLRTFNDFAQAKQPAIGDYKTVPAGQYAKEALEKLGLWQRVAGKVSLGSNVVEVLHWVAQGSADAGLVYATDAASNKQVKIVAPVPKGSLMHPIVYPLVVLKSGAQNPQVQSFVAFLQSKEAQAVYQEYGFSQ